MNSPESLERYKIFSIEEVLSSVSKGKSGTKSYDGRIVKISTKRLQTFKTHGIKCKTCGIEGQYFALEHHKFQTSSPNKWHFNLYAVENGIEILMTRDHIIPRSRGGSDNLRNSQTLCYKCNNQKGSNLDFTKEELNGGCK